MRILQSTYAICRLSTLPWLEERMDVEMSDMALQMDNIPEEHRSEIAEIQARLNNDGMRGVHELLLQKFDEIRHQPLTIAVIGSSGAGKSTFINAIRGLTSDDDNSAPTGCVETTKEPKAYAQPGNEMLKFWDLPGVGTQDFPQDQYLDKIEFAKHDFFLILSESRFTNLDLWLSKEIIKSKRHFFFVRTKIGNDISSDRRTHPKTHNEEAVLTKVRENIKEQLRNGNDATDTNDDADSPVFLIDSLKREKFDFNRLQLQLFGEYPAIKRRALILAMSNFSQEVIREKIKVLRWEIWKVALFSAMAAAVPISGASAATDVAILISYIVRYLKVLGLDDDSLRLTSERTGCELATLTALVHELFPPSMAFMSGARELALFATDRGVQSFIKEFAKYLPYIGRVVAASHSFYVLYNTLHNTLDKMEMLALQVVHLSVAAAHARGDNDED